MWLQFVLLTIRQRRHLEPKRLQGSPHKLGPIIDSIQPLHSTTHSKRQLWLSKIFSYFKSSIHIQLFGYVVLTFITDQIERVGDRPLRKILDDLGGWPVVTAAWDGRPWDLIEVLAGMRGLYNAPILIDAWVAADDKNSSVNIIVVRARPSHCGCNGINEAMN